MNTLTFAAPLMVVVAAVAVLIGAAWLSFENWRRSGRHRVTGFLESIRFLLICLLLFSLLRPEFVRRIERKTTPEIAILTDASGSMKTRDVAASNAVITRADWLERQVNQQFWKPLETRAKVSVEPFAAPPTN